MIHTHIFLVLDIPYTLGNTQAGRLGSFNRGNFTCCASYITDV